MALPGRSKFSSKNKQTDVSGFRLGGNPVPNQNPMQTCKDVTYQHAQTCELPVKSNMLGKTHHRYRPVAKRIQTQGL